MSKMPALARVGVESGVEGALQAVGLRIGRAGFEVGNGDATFVTPVEVSV